MAFVTDSNDTQPLRQPPPTACLPAWATSEAFTRSSTAGGPRSGCCGTSSTAKATLRPDARDRHSTSVRETALLTLGGGALGRYLSADEVTTEALLCALRFHAKVPVATRQRLRRFLRRALLHEQRCFLQFVTGRSVLPRRQKIAVVYVGARGPRLPRARTCFQGLQLPTCADGRTFERSMRAIWHLSFDREDNQGRL